MISGKKCNKCQKKMNRDYEFCPYCGSSTNQNWGMLGKEDSLPSFEDELFNSISGGFLGKMVGGMVRMIEKEMQKEMKRNVKTPSTNFRLMVNGREIPMSKQTRIEPKKIELPQLSLGRIKEMKKLSKKEPETKIRRLSDKVVYEINMPGVESPKDVSITPLENSIEIKAVGRKYAYSKIIPVNMPIINYKIEDNRLILELNSHEPANSRPRSDF